MPSSKTIPIHMVWVGSPVCFSPGKQLTLEFFNILTRGVRMLKTDEYSRLASDVGGFLSFLEEIYCNPADGDKIELYFHCYGEFIELYNEIFELFCKDCRLRYPASPPPIFHVKSIEETLKSWEEVDDKTSFLLNAYYQFIRDERVKNIRNKVNFRDVFNFCLLYRFGGYTFDANICVLPSLLSLPEPLLSKISKIREYYKIPLKLPFTSTITKIPLRPYVEPVTVYQFPVRKIFLSLNKTEFIMPIETDVKGNWHKFQCSNCHDIYALRSEPKISDLKETVECLIVNFIKAAQIFATLGHWNMANYNPQTGQAIYSNYYSASIVSAILGGVYKYVKNAISAPSPAPNTVKVLILPKRPSNIEHFVTFNEDRRGIFITLPLIKHFQNTHFVKPEYYANRSFFISEIEAIKEHLNINIKHATLKFSGDYYFP